MADKKTKHDKKQDKQLDELQQQIEELQKKLGEQEEITQRAQSDYFRLKLDMDAYMKRADAAKKTANIDGLVSMSGKLLPFLTQLEQSLLHLPPELADTPWVGGVQLIYEKAVQDMIGLGIVPIPAEEGMDPDLTLHMPINMQDVEDASLKGKIVQVIEQGWTYDKDGHTQVISPAKIIVGT